jgi:hypothetical protein
MVCDDFLSLDDLSPWGLAERLRENLFVEGVLTRLLMVVHVHALSPRGHDPHGGGHFRLLHRLMTRMAHT